MLFTDITYNQSHEPTMIVKIDPNHTESLHIGESNIDINNNNNSNVSNNNKKNIYNNNNNISPLLNKLDAILHTKHPERQLANKIFEQCELPNSPNIDTILVDLFTLNTQMPSFLKLCQTMQ